MQRSFQQEAMTAVAASTDGTYIAAGGVSGSIYIWTAADGCLVMVWPAHFKVDIVSFSSSGTATMQVTAMCRSPCHLMRMPTDHVYPGRA